MLVFWTCPFAVRADATAGSVLIMQKVGFEDGLRFGGPSFVVDPLGSVLAGPRALESALEVDEREPKVR